MIRLQEKLVTIYCLNRALVNVNTEFVKEFKKLFPQGIVDKIHTVQINPAPEGYTLDIYCLTGDVETVLTDLKMIGGGLEWYTSQDDGNFSILSLELNDDVISTLPNIFYETY